MVKALSKYMPKVAWFFVITASLVTLYDWIFADIVPAISLIKYWIVTAIVVIVTLFVTGVLNFGEVKEKATEKAKEANSSDKADTVYKIIYGVGIFVAVLMIGTILAVKFHWNNFVTYQIAMKVNEVKVFIWDLVILVVTFLVEKITD